MQRESRLARVLWITLVVLLGGYVVADFVRSPFVASRGSAAVRAAALTLWTPAAEAGGETGAAVRDAAAGLELDGLTVATKTISGGSSEAIAEFLARPPHGDGIPVLVLSSATFADIAHDRHDRLVPGAAEDAALARALLRQAKPIDQLESEPLSLGVDPRSSVGDPGAFLSALRSAPSAQLFGISDDTWSRDELAALVNRAGVDGQVPFSVFQSGAAAAQAVETGDAAAVLAPRGALTEEFRSGRLRQLGWPFGAGSRAPRFWVAALAPANLSPSAVE